MTGLRRRNGRLIIAVLIVTAVFLVSLQFSGRYGGDFVHRVTLKLISPWQRAVHWVISSTLGVVERYILLVDLGDENRRLREELRRLQMENNELREHKQAVKRLRHLLLFKEQVHRVMIPAEVIAYSPLASFRTVVINKGRRDGLSEGMPVVTWEGVVGQIMRISEASSIILLIIDRNSSVDALVQGTRTRAMLEGEGGFRCRLRYVPRTDELRVGDRIVTSGLGRIFPKGLRIGEIVQVEKKEYGLFQDIEVEPSADFSRLEEVMVILTRESEDRQ